MFSRRSNWSAPPNRLTIARDRRREAGLEILDLTESNPTRVGLDYPFDEISAAFAKGSRAAYAPEPLGLRSAREILAAHLSTADDPVSPDDLAITASTSEAYGFLFKLLADPGDAILTPAPTYPLLDHLAELESLRLEHVALEREGRWRIAPADVERALHDRTRALVVVHPNNPTGSFLDDDEQRGLVELAARKSFALVSDEVFLDYPLAPPPGVAGAAARADLGLVFSLGGLSKSAGLPHLKLGWIRVGGVPGLRRKAIEALELVADNYLSVGTPVQEALGELLEFAPRIRERIRERTAENLTTLRRELAPIASAELFEPEGGWCAVVRLPRLGSDEEFALSLLEREGVVIHPGYFFDFPREWCVVVVSLLPEPARFAEGCRRLARSLE